jgi:hypothetical protein
MKNVKYPLFFCSSLLLLSLGLSSVLQAQEENEESEDTRATYQKLLHSLADTVFTIAWPTATYEKFRFDDYQTDDSTGEISLSFILYGEGLNDNFESALWLEVVLVLSEDNNYKAVRWGRHNGLIAPGVTTEAFGEVLKEIIQKNMSDRNVPSSAEDSTLQNQESETSLEEEKPELQIVKTYFELVAPNIASWAHPTALHKESKVTIQNQGVLLLLSFESQWNQREFFTQLQVTLNEEGDIHHLEVLKDTALFWAPFSTLSFIKEEVAEELTKKNEINDPARKRIIKTLSENANALSTLEVCRLILQFYWLDEIKTEYLKIKKLNAHFTEKNKSVK